MTRTVLFDGGRLAQRSGRTTPTGVDRVCLAYAEWLMGHPDVRFVPVHTRGDRVLALDGKWFSELVAATRARWTGDTVGEAERGLTELLARPRGNRSVAGARRPDREPRREAVTRLLKSRALPDIPGGSLYVNVGHSGLTSARLLSDLAAEGARSVLMVHDLIPITHPEYCRPGEAARHRTRIRVALRQGAVLVVNSETTARVLKQFAEAEGLACPTTVVAHLGLEPPFSDPDWRPAERPWFVHVGTIEARKNLAFLLTLWRRLEEHMGAHAPSLVLIGRSGWENEAVMDLLKQSAAAGTGAPCVGTARRGPVAPDARVAGRARALGGGGLRPSGGRGHGHGRAPDRLGHCRPPRTGAQGEADRSAGWPWLVQGDRTRLAGRSEARAVQGGDLERSLPHRCRGPADAAGHLTVRRLTRRLAPPGKAGKSEA